jgi:hypothetical protein
VITALFTGSPAESGIAERPQSGLGFYPYMDYDQMLELQDVLSEDV